MTSISQWIYDHLPTDADLGVTPKDLNRSAKDLDRAAKQTDSSIAKAFYATTGAVFEFGRNVCTPFNETAADLDRIARQSDFKISKWGTYGVGAFFTTGAQAFKLPHDVVMGTADFVADPVTAVKSIPAAVEQNGNAIINGVQDVFRGNVATGMTQLWSGVIGDSMIAAMALGVVKGAPKAYAAYADGMNGLAKMSRGNRIPTDAFDRAAQSPGFGAVRLPGWFARMLGREDAPVVIEPKVAASPGNLPHSNLKAIDGVRGEYATVLDLSAGEWFELPTEYEGFVDGKTGKLVLQEEAGYNRVKIQVNQAGHVSFGDISDLPSLAQRALRDTEIYSRRPQRISAMPEFGEVRMDGREASARERTAILGTAASHRPGLVLKSELAATLQPLLYSRDLLSDFRFSAKAIQKALNDISLPDAVEVRPDGRGSVLIGAGENQFRAKVEIHAERNAGGMNIGSLEAYLEVEKLVLKSELATKLQPFLYSRDLLSGFRFSAEAIQKVLNDISLPDAIEVRPDGRGSVLIVAGENQFRAKVGVHAKRNVHGLRIDSLEAYLEVEKLVAF